MSASKTVQTSLALVAGLVLALMTATVAQAAVGDLTQIGCVSNAGANGCTDPANDSLDGAKDVAVSPDGNSVYVVSQSANSLTHFARATDGSLTQTACFASGGENGCVDVTGSAMSSPRGLVVSPDGTSVYVLSTSAITEFDRASNGTLTWAACVNNNGTESCADLPGSSLSQMAGIAISGDGDSVYAVGEEFMMESTLTAFDRATDGTLTQTGCLRNHGGTVSGCTLIGGTAVHTMHLAQRITVSPDGTSVYLTSQIDTAVTHFSRAANGVLTSVGCISDAGSGCTNNDPDSLSSPLGIAVSPDSSHVYTSSSSIDALTDFARAGDGTLTHASCIASALTGCTDLVSDSLDGAYSVAVSPDGKSLYSGSQNAVNEFDIGADGSLTEGGCFANSGSYGCTTSIGSLSGVYGIVVSPDGKSVYATSQTADGVIAYSRETPPDPVAPPADPAPGVTLPDTTLVSGPNKMHRGRSASFKIASTKDPYRWECRMRRKDFVPCNSKMRANGLRRGNTYTFEARAIDSDGNVDPTPLKYKFSVK